MIITITNILSFLNSYIHKRPENQIISMDIWMPLDPCGVHSRR